MAVVVVVAVVAVLAVVANIIIVGLEVGCAVGALVASVGCALGVVEFTLPITQR